MSLSPSHCGVAARSRLVRGLQIGLLGFVEKGVKGFLIEHRPDSATIAT